VARLGLEAPAPIGLSERRSSAVCALDEATGQVVLFGGISELRSDDTWTWDGTDWTLRSPANQPPFRFETSAAYDGSLKDVVTFGGGSPNGQLGDTWAWTGSNWKQLTPNDAPSTRESPGMAWDAATGTVVLVGGQHGNKVLHDTWTL
jgi:hypothetical protein